MLASFDAAACASVEDNVDEEEAICINASTTMGNNIIRPKERVISSSRLD
jgi:hypothetical protein